MQKIHRTVEKPAETLRLASASQPFR